MARRGRGEEGRELEAGDAGERVREGGGAMALLFRRCSSSPFFVQSRKKRERQVERKSRGEGGEATKRPSASGLALSHGPDEDKSAAGHLV